VVRTRGGKISPDLLWSIFRQAMTDVENITEKLSIFIDTWRAMRHKIKRGE
jgi:hypothetical protein